ncbi:hypothetical protein FACS1894105_08260 [Clostridia bacterium]|nr:hypothetical protein FACS1894105_08260 [Clostridia bacterium]GHV13025.1 hypothetical protein FACS1894219_07090 [Clostridia bacterium]
METPSNNTKVMIKRSSLSVFNVTSKTVKGYGICGLITHRNIDEAYAFQDISGLLLFIESRLDDFNYPKAQFRPRRFVLENKKIKLERKRHMDTINLDEEKFANEESVNFLVKIDYRRNATWQGQITWLESNKKENFRSCLELVRLIDQAVNVSADAKVAKDNKERIKNR